MTMLLGLLKYAGWNYLPNVATRQFLSFVHSAYPRLFGREAPPPGSPEFVRNHRFTYLAVVVSYLVYTFYDAATTVEPNYYQMLGIEPTADDSTLKVAFRQFARRYHPDRVGPQGEAVFIQVRDAYEALKSPVKRFAYDRCVWPIVCYAHNSRSSDLALTPWSGHNVALSGSTFAMGSCKHPASTSPPSASFSYSPPLVVQVQSHT